MLEENLKREITIFHRQCTYSLLVKLWGDRKCEAIERKQDIIEMKKLIKGVMFMFDGDMELAHTMWEVHMSVL